MKKRKGLDWAEADDASVAEKVARIRELFTERQDAALQEVVALAIHEPFRFVLLDAIKSLGPSAGRPAYVPPSIQYALCLVDEEFGEACRAYAQSDRVDALRPSITRSIAAVAERLGVGASTIRAWWDRDPDSIAFRDSCLEIHGISRKSS